MLPLKGWKGNDALVRDLVTELVPSGDHQHHSKQKIFYTIETKNAKYCVIHPF